MPEAFLALSRTHAAREPLVPRAKLNNKQSNIYSIYQTVLVLFVASTRGGEFDYMKRSTYVALLFKCLSSLLVPVGAYRKAWVRFSFVLTLVTLDHFHFVNCNVFRFFNAYLIGFSHYKY